MNEYEKASIRYWAVEYSLRCNGAHNQSGKAVPPEKIIEDAKILEAYFHGRNPASVTILTTKDTKTNE